MREPGDGPLKCLYRVHDTVAAGRTAVEGGPDLDVVRTEEIYWKRLKLYEALWTFVCIAGMKLTNNDAERAIRPGVLWRICTT